MKVISIIIWENLTCTGGGGLQNATSASGICKKRTSVTGLSGEHIPEHHHEKIGENNHPIIDGLEDDESVTEDTDEVEVGVFQGSYFNRSGFKTSEKSRTAGKAYN